MTADYSAEIKIVIFLSVLEWQCDEWRLSWDCGWIAAKIACFNSENSDFVGRKFTKFWYDVAWLLPLNLLKVDLWSATQLSNAEAKYIGCSMRRRLYHFLFLNSGVSEPNLTKFLQGVQKWLPITFWRYRPSKMVRRKKLQKLAKMVF